MRRVTGVPAAALALLLPSAAAAILPGWLERPSFDQALSLRLSALREDPALRIGRGTLAFAPLVSAFYAARESRPAWLDAGRLTLQAQQFLAAAASADAEGLDPADYHMRSIGEAAIPREGDFLLKRSCGAQCRADLELLLTDAYFRLASHLLRGAGPGEEPAPDSLDPAGHLEQALGENRVGWSLERLLPDAREYHELRRWRRKYADLENAAGHPSGKVGRERSGGRGFDSRDLCARLRILEDLEAGAPCDSVSLAAALAGFQERHGLPATGRRDSVTLSALAGPAAPHLERIGAAMDLWRRLPREPGERHVLVMLPDFRLSAFAPGRGPLRMRALAGPGLRLSALETDSVASIVLNPHWEPPASLARRILLPEIMRDPGYLRRKNMEVLIARGPAIEPIEPECLDPAGLARGTSSFRLRQRCGPRNALGRYLFKLGGREDVYLHDTPPRDYFDDPSTLLHGSIRVERPRELALYLLSDRDDWHAAALAREVGRDVPVPIALERPVPVYFLDPPAFVSAADGKLRFASGRRGSLRTAASDS